ncbi:MAG: acetyl-CoA C-acetyltransferase [Acinetobacter harbinensis]|uniref:acetyl-CoA C-acetyltransferase n=1 Tax=Acinetobacter TaxID=469 RepID=UPI001C4F3ACB|nr:MULTISPECIES: acetyl-CoA C-acetyltransferase [Acinetobacter]MBR5556480.1 acetyl-CoA C-acetyltransferase [Acinetobacter sp.]MDD2940458.1 acetyl-CoA C-acetyltransferase [Acinetobacter harbinensis]
MSKTSQENPTPKNSAEKTVSNTSKRTSRTSQSSDTANPSASNTTQTTQPRSTSARHKSTASTSKKSTSTTQTSVQQDKIMSQNTVRRVAILGGNRIPFARSNGAYFTASNSDMFTAALNGLVERFNLQGQRLGEVVAGAVLKHSRDFNMTRECVLDTQLAPETPAYDIQQACGTGLQAAFIVANKIALGQIEVGVAGGVDTTSDAPIAFGDGLRKAFLELNVAKTAKDRFKALSKINFKDLLDAPRNGEPRTGLSMGDHQAITALEWGIAREAQDELAASSHQKMAAAYEEGFFDDLITPFLGLERDNNLRADSTVEKLAKLKPAFGKGDARTMTAGNSTPLTDGASCVLLASEEWAKANGHEVLAYLTFTETAAVDFVGKKEGLLMAPAYAVPRMLERAGITLQDFDYYEIHEAFASQVLSTLKAWEDPKFCKERLGLDAALGSIDRSKLNVKGSSLAAGHPFAATGGRILASAAKLLNQKGSGRVLISICAAGGQGVTAIIEK